MADRLLGHLIALRNVGNCLLYTGEVAPVRTIDTAIRRPKEHPLSANAVAGDDRHCATIVRDAPCHDAALLHNWPVAFVDHQVDRFLYRGRNYRAGVVTSGEIARNTISQLPSFCVVEANATTTLVGDFLDAGRVHGP